jgi:hypothetical protein
MATPSQPAPAKTAPAKTAPAKTAPAKTVPSPAAAPAVEQRRFVRYQVDAHVEITHPGGRASVSTEDLGAGGCRAVVPQPLEKGLSVTVRLTAPGCGTAVSGPARVAWASRAPPYRIGLQFSDEVAEQAIGFIHTVLGAVAIRTGQG